MCGIAGMIGTAARVDGPSILERMLTSIYHRGPDEDGRLIDGELAMGMRRLSIIDLAEGQQPIWDEAKRFGVIFNGEIYNYRELREELLARGHHLKTKSDTEVIVHLYEELGVDCLSKLRGMFAIAIWDTQERQLFIARDRLGIKPLYYTRRGSELIFGSEIKALLEHPAVEAQLDLQGLSDYLSLKYVPAPRTMFADIYSLPPGHYMLARGNEFKIETYWDLPAGISSAEQSSADEGEDVYAAKLLELLRESVKLRLRSDVPFGAFLSGGVDSSLIVALMAEQLTEPVRTFSVGFGGEGLSDELPYAAIVANKFKTDHHTLRITAADFLRHAEDVLWHLDQPIADQATVATHMVAALARQHVKMVLTGEGGDELFAGYARYVGERYAKWTSWWPDSLGRAARGLADHLPGMRRGKIAIGALTRRDEAARLANWFPMFSDDAKRELLAGQEDIYREGAAAVFATQLATRTGETALSRMLYVDTKLWLPDYLLLRGDKLTMANSLEARVPLLDHRVVEFATRLPDHYKLRGSTRKYLLKQIARKLLPNEIIDRGKQGFPIPIERWLRDEANGMLRELLASEVMTKRGLFNVEYVERLRKEHEAGFKDHATELWGLMSVEMWLRRFIDKSV